MIENPLKIPDISKTQDIVTTLPNFTILSIRKGVNSVQK